jgi:folate-binding protein YgfZ
MTDATIHRYDAVVVSGPEAESYLQGQLSQDVATMAEGEVKASFLLEPTGKVCAWLSVRRDAADRFTLWVDGGFGSLVIERLARFRLRTKVDIEPETEARAWPEVVLPEDERIAAGVPRMGAELVPGQTIPAEAGQQIIDWSVSFTKGCFTGQELVARIDSRGGHVPRHLRGIVVAGDVEPPPGATIEADGKDVGRLTSVARSVTREATIALGYVARAVTPPAPVTLRWDGGEAAAEVRTLPLT